MPDNCIDRQDCQVVSSYSRKSPDLIHFEILGKAEINDYIALGLSQDPFMRNDSVVACTANEVKAFWNFYYYSLPMQDPVANLHEPFTEYQDGMIYCSFDYDSLAFIQTPPPAEIDLVLDLVNDEFHLLLSKGPFDVDDGKLSLHTQKVASDEAFSLIQFPLQLKSTENKQQDIYEGCGDNLQCWGIPDQCIDTKNCESMVKFMQDESSGDVSFQLYGNNLQTGSYVAVGLTEDQGMQDASVVHCYEENGNAGVGMSWNMNYGNIVLNDTSAIMDAKAALENGMLSCNFKWKKVSNVTVPDGNGNVVTFDLSISKKYHLILAKGAYDKSVLKQHSHTDRGKTSDKIDFAGGSEDDIYSDCGTADHQCFGFPDKCINNKSCESLVKFMQDESSGDVSFQLYGKNLKTGSYVAVGLTEDQGMQNASVVHCYEENGNAGVGMSWNMNYGNVVLNDTTAIMDAKATLENGMLSCNFKWKKVSNVTVPGGNGDVVTFDLGISKKFHLILAKGAYDKAVLKQHTSTDRWKTNDKIDFAGKPGVDIYSGCGKEKGCFGNSDNCIEGKNCSFVTRFQGVSNSSYMIEILGELSDDNKYVAVALSLDHLMGDDSVIACIWNETTSMAEVQMYWTDGYNSYSNDNTTKKFTTYPLDNPSQGITNATGQLVDNQLYCNFVRDAKMSITPPGQQKAIDFDMNETPYHILLAIGPLINDTKVGHHTDKAASSKTYSFSDFNTFLDTTYAGCGTTFGCFGIPDKCLDSFNCEVFTKYAQDENGDVSFNVYGPNLGANSYAAVAIVEESGMGDASVMFCYDHKNVNGVGMSWNKGQSDSLILNDTTGGLSDMQASLTDGLLSCSFVRGKNTDITIPDDDNTIKTFDMSNKYYVLLAKGPISDGDSSLNFTLGYHTDKGITSAPVDFSEFIVVKGKGQILLLVSVFQKCIFKNWIFTHFLLIFRFMVV